MTAGQGFIQAFRTRYLLASIEHPHFAAEAPTGLAPLAGGALQATADTRYSALKALLIAHFAHAGAAYNASGVHLNADVTNGATMALDPNGVLARLIACIAQMKTALIAGGHADDIAPNAVHLNALASHSDPVLGAMTLTVDPPVTLANCVTDLNDILAAVEAHFAAAAPTT